MAAVSTDLLAYKLVGCVPVEQVPDPLQQRRQGMWTSLADVVLRDYAAEMATVVEVKDTDALDKMKNGLRIPLRDRNPDVRLVVSTVAQEDGTQRVYLRLFKSPNA